MNFKFNKYLSAVNFSLIILLGVCYLGYGFLNVPSFMMPIGRLHPLLLHLPIGLWIGSLLIFILAPESKRASNIIMKSSAATALLSALVGLFLSKESGYNPEDLFWHRHTGTFFAVFAYMASADMMDKLRNVKLIFMGIATLLLVVSGHLGAEITHGKGFLLPETKGEKVRMVCNDNSNIYTSLVFPVLEEKCMSCHNPRKAKSSFMMSDTVSFLKGGESGKTIIDRQNIEKSYLLQVLKLPSSAEMHMPPKGKKQLTPEELKIIESWLNLGAPFNAKVKSLPGDHALRTICQDRSVSNRDIYDFSPASTDLLEEINTDFLTVQPLAANSPALSGVFFVASAFSSQAFAKLNKVKKQLVNLDLSFMPLTEKDWKTLGNFNQLEKLTLNSSSFTDDHLEVLTKLPNLKSLALNETNVSEKLGDYLKQIPKLQDVYLGQTKIPASTILDWRKRFQNLEIHFLEPDNEIIPLSPPSITYLNEMHHADNLIVLDNVIQGVTIRYTLDGSEPDSLNGLVYQDPIPIQKINKIKAVAIKEGWLTSEVNEALYFGAGFKPDSAYLLFPPNPRYPGEGVKTLLDFKTARIDNLKDRSWIAFRQKPMIADFLFQDDLKISSIIISYGIHIPQYVFPPSSIKVSGGENIDNLELLYSITTPPIRKDQKDEVRETYLELNFKKKEYDMIRIECHNLNKLPPWHRGAGEKSWFHVNEIYFY